MEFDFSTLSTADRYKLMGSAITPRPIAWVTTRAADGSRNAAPYSFFNMLGAEPPLVVLGIMHRPDGTPKDTAANILATGDFVVNLVGEGDAPAMNLTCIDAPAGVDELDLAGIATTPSSVVAAPRIASAPVAMECRLHQAIEVTATTIILGEVMRFHIADGFVDPERLHVDAVAMNLVARMHGAGWYTRCHDLFQLQRPTYAEWLAATDPA